MKLKEIVNELNILLANSKNLSKSHPYFVFITGASGSGKTFLAHKLEKILNKDFVHIAYFDRIGVPAFEDMVDIYGSGEKWQEASTHIWVKQLSELKKDKAVIILEGQYNPQFALDACKKLKISNYLFIDIHANRQIREKRLIEKRNQPELANENMNSWGEFLKRKTIEVGGSIIDSSSSDSIGNVLELIYLIKEALRISTKNQKQ